jgi:hypothetical protein
MRAAQLHQDRCEDVSADINVSTYLTFKHLHPTSSF